MSVILIVDDEKIEREGIKYLLALENKNYEILEAPNGEKALAVLEEQPVDLLFTDIKMPRMDGLELSRRVREAYPDLPIVIFSGYNDFSFAQEALRYGVTDYVLKPVDPEQFHKVVVKAEAQVSRISARAMRQKKEQSFLQQYFLQNYLYSGSPEILEKAKELVDLEGWNQWRRAVIVEANKDFFDTGEEDLPQEIQKELRRTFFYLNLNARQSLLFFNDVYCDYMLVAKHIYVYLKQHYSASFYLGVSGLFEGYKDLPQVLEQLEQLMEEKFYHPEQHIFSQEDENLAQRNDEKQDSQVMQKISEDISRKDAQQLWKHFRILVDKYRDNQKYSSMYIKFVFSSVIQELCQEDQFSGEKRLEREVERLYHCKSMNEILQVTEENIRSYEEFLGRSMAESREEVAAVKNYIYQHYGEDLGIEMLAEKVYLSSGYLSYIFKKETGMNLNRFIRVFRMEKAKELLCTTNMKVVQVSEAVGFANVSYFIRSFREYYGNTPESYRKGTGDHEESPS